MLTTRKADIPEYLHESEFYLSLECSDDETIEIPNHVLQPDTSIANNEDVRLMLCTIRFWGLPCCPESVVLYILDNITSLDEAQILSDFESQLTYVTFLRMLA